VAEGEYGEVRMTAGKRLIVVLGMHRSGTSTVIKGLEALGVNLGTDFHPIRPDNPKGDWEAKAFHGLNEEMLGKLGRSWDDLEALDEAKVLGFCAEDFFSRGLSALHAHIRDDAVSGIKDPRFALLLPFWQRVFVEAGLDVSYVICLRNPLSVAHSLSRRDGFTTAKGLGLWRLYNTHIASGTASACRVVVDYDALLDDSKSQLLRVARFLKLTMNDLVEAEFSSEFLDPALRHARFAHADLRMDTNYDPLVLQLYQTLGFEALKN